MKTCNKCKVNKETTEFVVRGKGLHSWCNPCRIEYHRAQNKLWYANNTERNFQRSTNWRKINPNKVKEILRKSRFKNSDVIAKRQNVYLRTPLGRFKMLRNRAVCKGIELTLTLEEFSEIISFPCAYCGEKEQRIGIDKMDNSKGYTKENSAPCCKTCNYMKKTSTVEDFLSHIKKIATHNA